jgi:hypothetical protein
MVPEEKIVYDICAARAAGPHGCRVKDNTLAESNLCASVTGQTAGT